MGSSASCPTPSTTGSASTAPMPWCRRSATSSTGLLGSRLGITTSYEEPRRTVLTIGQLAATAGVTVRTVRHYHHVGLLPEPERDASGYRRYSAQAAVDLIRIRTLAEAGVPLARIDALLHAQPAEFASAITDIDAELQRKIDQLTEYRRRIAELAGGESLVLPPEVVAILNRLRGLG